MIVLVIEGAIGAGKSTLLTTLNNELSKHYNVVSISEPVDLWVSSGALEDFYKNVTSKGYEFQTFAFCTRVQKVQRMFEENPNADIFIIERSPYSDKYIFLDMLREAGHITPQQVVKYEIWWKTWMKLWPFKPTHFIHLNPGLEVCLARKNFRSREGESRVDIDYETALINKHQDFFSSHCPYPILEISDDIDFREGSGLIEMMRRVRTFLGLENVDIKS